MKQLIALLLCCSPIAAQSIDDFAHRYGRPISLTYEVRPGIFATINSTNAGEVCQMFISPQLTSETLDYPSTKTMKSDQLTEIINELVPVKDRGRGTLNSFVNIMCLPLNNCAGATDNYEHVRIFRNGGTDKERYASIRLLKPGCDK
jgi:hypothetical protein